LPAAPFPSLPPVPFQYFQNKAFAGFRKHKAEGFQEGPTEMKKNVEAQQLKEETISYWQQRANTAAIALAMEASDEIREEAEYSHEMLQHVLFLQEADWIAMHEENREEEGENDEETEEETE
jgi:hypothetical protein